eukprot:TRINITY_DN2296_c0_g1_i1.p1 TRINITY_DN2296_c0_g1~~TRINITY_DN2296_c0_g1_i1.p1  ORF type:complete len:111 (-),score=20.58 TRINITY_DN2296_c0_g1_i1:431-763(-)
MESAFKESPPQLIAGALANKAAGNEFMANQKWTEAITEYYFGINKLRAIPGLVVSPSAHIASSSQPKASDEEFKTSKELLTVLKLNLAQALLKTHKYESVVRNLDEVCLG